MKHSRIDLNLLPVLHAILREKSVTKVADSLGKTQPAISFALQKLRCSLGDDILIRNGRGMKLTPRGEELAREVEDIMHSASRLLEPSAFDPAVSRNVFTIAAIDYLLMYLAPMIARRIKAVSPEVVLRFVTVGRAWEHHLETGSIDLAIVPFGGIETQSFKSRVLYEDAIKCVGSPNNKALSDTLNLDQMLSLPHVIFDRGDGYFGAMNSFYDAYPQVTNGAMFTPHMYILCLVCAFSNCLGLVPEQIASDVGQMPLRLYDPPVQISPIKMAMIWNPRYDNDAAHAWLRSILVELVAESKKVRPQVYDYAEF